MVEQSFKIQRAGAPSSTQGLAVGAAGAAATPPDLFPGLLALAGDPSASLAPPAPQGAVATTSAAGTVPISTVAGGNTRPAAGKPSPPDELSAWVRALVGVTEQDTPPPDPAVVGQEASEGASPEATGLDTGEVTLPIAADVVESPGTAAMVASAAHPPAPSTSVVTSPAGHGEQDTPSIMAADAGAQVEAGGAGEHVTSPRSDGRSQLTPPATANQADAEHSLPTPGSQRDLVVTTQQAQGPTPVPSPTPAVESQTTAAASASGAQVQPTSGSVAAPELAHRSLEASPTAPPQGGNQPGSLEITSGLHEPGWGDELGDRVAVHLAQGGRSAELRVNPADLGPVEMRVSIDRDRATVSFVSHDAAVREAIQEAMPRLRDAFSAQGLQLVEARVGADAGSGQQSRGSPMLTPTFGLEHPIGDNLDEVAEPRIMRTDGGLLDTYA